MTADPFTVVIRVRHAGNVYVPMKHIPRPHAPDHGLCGGEITRGTLATARERERAARCKRCLRSLERKAVR